MTTATAARRYAATVSATLLLGAHHDGLETLVNEFVVDLPDSVRAEILSHQQSCLRLLKVIESSIPDAEG